LCPTPKCAYRRVIRNERCPKTSAISNRLAPSPAKYDAQVCLLCRYRRRRHTFGYRLGAAGVSFEDRKTLLGHKASHVTTHYSAADIETLIALADKVCDLGSRKSPALSIVRAEGASQVPEMIGGKGGTRTLDPGIMSASVV